MANYNQILPIRKDCRIDEQFGWLPLSVLEPSRDHREQCRKHILMMEFVKQKEVKMQRIFLP